MLDLAPRPGDLEPIETASRDELAALQLERLRWTLRHAYENVALLPERLRRRGRPPGRLPRPRRSRAVPVHDQGRPARELSVRHVRGAARAGRPHPRVERDDRPADGRRLHAATTSTRGRRDGALDPRRRRPAGRHRARRVRLRAVHRRPRRALRRGTPRLHGRSGVRRHDRAAGAADPRLPARHHHGDAVVHARDRRRVRAAGHRPARARRSRSASSAPSRGRRDARARSRSGSTSTRSTSTGSPR